VQRTAQQLDADKRTFPRLQPFELVNETNCLREPIRVPGAIQPHAVLLVANEDFLTTHVSENAVDLFGVPVAEVLGQSIYDVLGAGASGALKGDLTQLGALGRQPFAAVLPNGTEVSVTAHTLAQTPANPISFHQQLRIAVASLHDTKDLDELWARTADVVRQLTGFDRVWVYRFEPDAHGVIVAENKRNDIESFMGLHYPETDIPPLARALFIENWLRLIPDSHANSVPVVSRPGASEPLDMTHVSARAVSPVHLDYLKNMGVRASMSVSLIVEGTLWGLISCHHYEGPRILQYEERAAAEFIGIVCSMQIAGKTAQDESEYQVKIDRAQANLLDRLSTSPSVASGLFEGKHDLLQICGAEGAAIAIANEFHLVGLTPEDAVVRRLISVLQQREGSDPFVSDNLSETYPEFSSIKDVASGVIAIPFSRHQGNFILWFRPEVLKTIDWGNHNVATTFVSVAQQALRPENSFAEWAETVRMHSSPWRKSETAAVQGLRSSVGNLLLVRAEQLARANAELRRANEELDAFAYIASHDLKEPLRGIHSYTTMVVEDYSDVLDEPGLQRLEAVLRLSRRMGALVDSLLNFAQVGRSELHRTDVELRSVISEAVEHVQVRIEESGTQLHVHPDLGVVNVDRERLRDVLVNLISNAIKYGGKSNPTVEIGTTTVRDTASGPALVRRSIGSEVEPAVIFVRDNGVGIEGDHLEDIFRVFRRLDQETGSQPGTGVGLTICRRIVERHGGVIWCESELGHGSCFYFTLESA
jgi:two-component system, chemotaxis family, sensor kinase Cph1